MVCITSVIVVNTSLSATTPTSFPPSVTYARFSPSRENSEWTCARNTNHTTFMYWMNAGYVSHLEETRMGYDLKWRGVDDNRGEIDRLVQNRLFPCKSLRMRHTWLLLDFLSLTSSPIRSNRAGASSEIEWRCASERKKPRMLLIVQSIGYAHQTSYGRAHLCVLAGICHRVDRFCGASLELIRWSSEGKKKTCLGYVERVGCLFMMVLILDILILTLLDIFVLMASLRRCINAFLLFFLVFIFHSTCKSGNSKYGRSHSPSRFLASLRCCHCFLHQSEYYYHADSERKISDLILEHL